MTVSVPCSTALNHPSTSQSRHPSPPTPQTPASTPGPMPPGWAARSHGSLPHCPCRRSSSTPAAAPAAILPDSSPPVTCREPRRRRVHRQRRRFPQPDLGAEFEFDRQVRDVGAEAASRLELDPIAGSVIASLATAWRSAEIVARLIPSRPFCGRSSAGHCSDTGTGSTSVRAVCEGACSGWAVSYRRPVRVEVGVHDEDAELDRSCRCREAGDREGGDHLVEVGGDGWVLGRVGLLMRLLLARAR